MTDQLALFPMTDAEKRVLDFWAFHNAHPEVYTELRRRALDLRNRGWKRWGIRNLWERMRYEFALQSNGEFKLNNNLPPFYARLLMAQESDLEGFFETRGNTNGQ